METKAGPDLVRGHLRRVLARIVNGTGDAGPLHNALTHTNAIIVLTKTRGLVDDTSTRLSLRGSQKERRKPFSRGKSYRDVGVSDNLEGNSAQGGVEGEKRGITLTHQPGTGELLKDLIPIG